MHIPVMLNEVLDILKPQSGGVYIDCTLGSGGYSWAIAERIGRSGRVVALDADSKAITAAKEKTKKTKIKNIDIIHGNFRDLHKIIKECLPAKRAAFANGIVFDLGLSSAQLQDKFRGFSFLLDAPLDMAFDQTAGRGRETTEYIVNNYSGAGLCGLLKEFGEEQHAKRIAQGIVEYRKTKLIAMTGQLVDIIKKSVPTAYLQKKINPATKTFQALRIATNNELENLRLALPQAVDMLMPEGRLVVLSYHSLEDRIVKNYLRQEAKDCLCPPELPVCRCGHSAQLKLITRKVLVPREQEVADNPRARSAKLRAAEKI